jgi:hypothetical protein
VTVPRTKIHRRLSVRNGSFSRAAEGTEPEDEDDNGEFQRS